MGFIQKLVSEQCSAPGHRYMPFAMTIFLFISFSNLLGLIPYSFTITSHIAVSFGLSGSLWLGVVYLGLANHGINFFSFFLPANAPFMLAPFLVLIEVISYCIRAVSLSVRLSANLFAGHLLLVLGCTFC